MGSTNSRPPRKDAQRPVLPGLRRVDDWIDRWYVSNYGPDEYGNPIRLETRHA